MKNIWDATKCFMSTLFLFKLFLPWFRRLSCPNLDTPIISNIATTLTLEKISLHCLRTSQISKVLNLISFRKDTVWHMTHMTYTTQGTRHPYGSTCWPNCSKLSASEIPMNHGFYVSKKVKVVSGLLSLLYHSNHSISKPDRLTTEGWVWPTRWAW